MPGTSDNKRVGFAPSNCNYAEHVKNTFGYQPSANTTPSLGRGNGTNANARLQDAPPDSVLNGAGAGLGLGFGLGVGVSGGGGAELGLGGESVSISGELRSRSGEGRVVFHSQSRLTSHTPHRIHHGGAFPDRLWFGLCSRRRPKGGVWLESPHAGPSTRDAAVTCHCEDAWMWGRVGELRRAWNLMPG